MLRTLLAEVMSCAIKRKFHTMMMFGERATNRGGQPQGIAPTLRDCRGNPFEAKVFARKNFSLEYGCPL